MSLLYNKLHVLYLLLVLHIPIGNLVPDVPLRDDTPILEKGAAFIYKYQAVTSESENKVRKISLFPQPPLVELSPPISCIENLSTIRSYLKTLPFIQRVADSYPCPFAVNTCVERADELKEGLEYRLGLIGNEISAIAMDYTQLLRVDSSFALPPVENALSRSVHNQSRRMAPALMAVSGVAGLFLGNPVQNAAGKALSIFSLCNVNRGLKNTVGTLMQQQKNLARNLRSVQESNDENFFLLGTEIAESQKSVHALRDVIDAHLNATGEAIRDLSSQFSLFHTCLSVQTHFELVVA